MSLYEQYGAAADIIRARIGASSDPTGKSPEELASIAEFHAGFINCACPVCVAHSNQSGGR